MVSYRGLWRITVTGKDSAYDQRVVITGASTGGGIVPGTVGTSQVVDGTDWTLNIQHNDGSGWSDNAAVLPDPMQELGAPMSQVVRSQDVYWPGDTDTNDLVVWEQHQDCRRSGRRSPYSNDDRGTRWHILVMPLMYAQWLCGNCRAGIRLGRT